MKIVVLINSSLLLFILALGAFSVLIIGGAQLRCDGASEKKHDYSHSHVKHQVIDGADMLQVVMMNAAVDQDGADNRMSDSQSDILSCSSQMFRQPFLFHPRCKQLRLNRLLRAIMKDSLVIIQ